MRYIIYVDVFFTINMVMDFILLKVTAHFIKPHTTFLRCLLGGVAGSILSVASLMLSYENMLVHMLVTYIFTASAMVFVTYGKVDLRRFALRVGWLYLVTVVFGGVMNMLYSYTYFGYIVQGIMKSMYNNPITTVKLILFTGIAYVALSLVRRLWEKKRNVNEYVKVAVVFKGKTIELTGLIDTGNTLNCPYSMKPVHIVEYKALEKVIEGVNIYEEKYRLVPFNSLGRKNGIIEVIECDEIKVYGHISYTEGIQDVNREEIGDNIIYYDRKPAIGIYRERLTATKRYRVLLHSIVGA